ncbi:spidroin-2-like [Alligator mississippiensis]|uniref:spidroin-2-like n=1 Tax=Alligator mississippiensis TaxID=8496 RepID=UPI0007120706|nr:spidroin-2-like [Alligator mississippiensis]
MCAAKRVQDGWPQRWAFRPGPGNAGPGSGGGGAALPGSRRLSLTSAGFGDLQPLLPRGPRWPPGPVPLLRCGFPPPRPSLRAPGPRGAGAGGRAGAGGDAAARKRKEPGTAAAGGAAKLAKPAADSNPALLEAFKAVVAAGGSDWLDPEAVAAVVTGDPPDSAAKCEKKAPGSPKVAEPEAAVPTPGAPASPTPQPNAEAGATESLPVLQPDPSFGSVALGDGSLLQADPKEIWIFGHSVISAVKKRANNHPCGLQLAFPITSVFVYWHDVQEMLWDQLVPLLHEVYFLRTSPSVLVIHLGENDLLQQSSTSLLIKMKNDLGVLRRAFPDAYIVWSSLLPRRFWKGTKTPLTKEEERQEINREMFYYCKANNIIFLQHDFITSKRPNMFLPDADELSDVGADVFISNLKAVLHSCMGFGRG